MTLRKKKLGRGLDALLGASQQSAAPEVGASDGPQDPVSDDGTLKNLPIEYLRRGKYQPRRDFDEGALEELAASIRAQGIMQPIVVRHLDTANQYEIIAGERRWRAAQLAGLDVVPVVIKDVTDEAAIAMALIENIQRENLSPLEEASALKRLQTEFELSQQQVADAVGKSRSVIANLLRLLSLETEVQDLLQLGSIDTGHAKVLLALEGQQQVTAAKQVAKQGLTVRQTEALVKTLALDTPPEPPKKDPDIQRLEQDLASILGAKVAIAHTTSGRGKLVINYTDLDELDGILAKIR
jgi:ParB family chromosome partitioning protein